MRRAVLICAVLVALLPSAPKLQNEFGVGFAHTPGDRCQ